ncbi:MAG: hypothetical protein ACW981_07880 [Candidatus Hodarchaeales archaeon]|jgi:hypothetical protein
MKRKKIVIKFLKKYESGNSCDFENIMIPGFDEIKDIFSERKITIIELVEEDNKIIAFWNFYGKKHCSQSRMRNEKKMIIIRGSHVFYFHFNKIISVISTLTDFLTRNRIENIIEAETDEIETFKEYLQTLVAMNIS